MNLDDTNKPQDAVEKSPVIKYDSENAIHLWIIIGCSVGAVVIIVIIAVLIYFRRHVSKDKKVTDLPSFIIGTEGCYQAKNHGSFSSIGSEDDSASESASTQDGKPAGYHSSYDTTGIPYVTSECVQPKQSSALWYSVSPNCQSTTTISTTGNIPISDNEPPGSNACVNGRLWFSVHFLTDNEELKVTVIRAKYLPGRGLTNSPRDPFVKVFLLPDEENSYQSKIRKRTLNPKFNEAFTFKVNSNELAEKSIRFSVYDVDKRKIRHNLGHIIFPLNRSEFLNGDILWKDLDSNAQQSSPLGEIRVGLGYNPSTSRIKVIIGGVRNIQRITEHDISIFVKVQLYHGHKLMKNRKTATVPLTFNSETETKEITFEEIFNFGVSGRFFDSCSFTFSLMMTNSISLPKGSLPKPHGRIVIGPFMYARGDQLQHWHEMLNNTRNIITKWHNLDPIVID